MIKPLSFYIPVDYLPNFFKPLANQIFFTQEAFVFNDTGYSLNLTLTLANESPIDEFLFPSLTSPITVQFQHLTTLSILKIHDGFALRYNPTSVRILLPELLKNATLQDGKLVSTNSRAVINLELTNKYIEFNTFEGLHFIGADLTSFVPELSTSFVIGETGIGLSLDHVKFDLLEDGIEISIQKAKLFLPPALSLLPNLEINSGVINQNGFSGEVKFDWDLSFDSTNANNIHYKMNGQEVKLFGNFTGGIDFLAITFENNAIKSCNITGEMLIPYFDESTMRIAITIDNAGNCELVVKSTSGNEIHLKKDDLLSLYVKSLTIDQASSTVSISGGIEPLLYASEGMKWPRMDVKDLKIDSTGKFSIDEAWLELKDLATLDLFGFNLELRRIGLGTSRENNLDKLWIDLSGGLKLIDQIPIGVDVEGFRVLWPQDTRSLNSIGALAEAIDIQFKGVGLNFAVPGAIQLDGLIRFFKDGKTTGFAGDMVLAIPPAGIIAEAGLMVGMNEEQPNPYKFFYVYFGLEAAAGIPLGQSGLALKGAMGLFGINVAPNKTANQNWYYDWYKKDPAPGAHQTTKWANKRDALAVGAGLTITTVDGIVKGTKGIVVLALPGPILVISGKAMVLDGLNPDAEPPFSATAIFDGKSKIVQFNIEAQAELVKNMVDAYAGVEAFFDFKDITNWHVYLGEDEPKNRRIRANILNIVEADAYMMLDMIGANSPRTRMGLSVSINPKIDEISFDLPLIGTQSITFDAHLNLEGQGEISIQPEQFSGKALIDAGIEISAFGLTVDISAKVDITIEGPSPFSLQGDLELHANLPDPLPDYDDNFHFELKIPEVNLNINAPLTAVSHFSRFKSESKRSTIFTARLADTSLNNLVDIPLVECDINPLLAFEHEMNQDCDFIMHPGGSKSHRMGPVKYTPTLKSVTIREKEKKEGSRWKIIYSTILADQTAPLIGTWLAENNPSSPARPSSSRLQLMTTNPLTNTVFSTGTMGFLMMQDEAENEHLSAQIVTDHPDLMMCERNVKKPVCIDFKYAGKPIQSKEIRWAFLKMNSTTDLFISDNCLMTQLEIEIEFPENVLWVDIEFCYDHTLLTFKTFSDSKLMVDNKVVKISKGYNIASPNTPFSSLIINTGSKDKRGIQIKSICYYTEQNELDFKLNTSICKNNSKKLTTSSSNSILSENYLFKPSCYYEIEVKSALIPNIDATKIQEKNELIKTYILNQYQDKIENLDTAYTQYSYFQTDAPPQNLKPYVKWCIPSAQAKRIFVEDSFQIRFKRGYLHALYQNDALKIYLKSSKGIFNEVKEISWTKAKSSTLFPDEETWKDHLGNKGIETGFKLDDILQVDLKTAPSYHPNNRYELVIVGQKRSDINQTNDQNERVIQIEGSYYNLLFSQQFTTAIQPSFSALLSTIESVYQPINAVANPIPTSNFDVLSSQIVDCEQNYYQCLIDYEYGIAKANTTSKLIGKEALAYHHLKMREAKDKLDDEFKRLALMINTEVFFTSNDRKLTIYNLKTSDAKVKYLWIKLPEALHLKQQKASLGDLEVSLKYNGIATINRIHNSDTSEIIYILKNTGTNANLNLANLNLTMTRIKDFKDDGSEKVVTLKNKHHRYDRPSFKDGSQEQIIIKLA